MCCLKNEEEAYEELNSKLPNLGDFVTTADGLKGEDIPMIARIVAVADAYDAMTSNRSYRSELPQATVRAEIEKNIGTQFAPEIAKVMLQMIDEDKEYTMREEKKPFGQQAV